jgi:hypothetical protein
LTKKQSIKSEMSELPASIEDKILELSSLTSRLRERLEPYMKMDMKELESRLSEQQRVSLRLWLACSVNQLFHAYLKTQGVCTAEHPVNEELKRLILYKKKLDHLARTTGGAQMHFTSARVNSVLSDAVQMAEAMQRQHDAEQSLPQDLGLNDRSHVVAPGSGTSKQSKKTRDRMRTREMLARKKAEAEAGIVPEPAGKKRVRPEDVPIQVPDDFGKSTTKSKKKRARK